jgi:DNA-binding XRE family transcriptional regulator
VALNGCLEASSVSLQGVSEMPYVRRAIEQYSGKNLKERREFALLSQAELSARVGVTRETISYWETGKRVPSLTNARRLRDVLLSLIRQAE